MKNINPANKYLMAAQASRGRFHNADGFFDRDVVAGSRGFYADASTAPAAAAAAPTPGNKPTSQPYVLVITSTSGSAVPNFDVLGSYEYLTNPPAGFSWDPSGNLVSGSVTISSGLGGITYSRMLAQFVSQPFTVGTTYINSVTAGQVTQPMTLTITDANGRSASNPMLPVLDPYQQQSTVIAFTQKFRMDGNTKITLSSILANATITLYLYPIDDFNPVRSLGDGQVVKSFDNPNIVKAQKVFIGS